VVVGVAMIMAVIMIVVGDGRALLPLRAAARARHARDFDADVARRQRAAVHARHPQAMLHAQPGEVGFQLALREPEVEQRAEEHVAGDAGEEVEVQRARAVPGAVRARPRAG
jgi:hypothetical protein